MNCSTPGSSGHRSTPGSTLEYSGPLPSLPLFKPPIGATRFEPVAGLSFRDHRYPRRQLEEVDRRLDDPGVPSERFIPVMSVQSSQVPWSAMGQMRPAPAT
jgi:hypothetical protein